MLDPVADKALLVSVYVTLAAIGVLPDWLAILVVFRDLVIVGGVLMLWVLGQPPAIRPLLVSKLNTALQIALVGAGPAAGRLRPGAGGAAGRDDLGGRRHHADLRRGLCGSACAALVGPVSAAVNRARRAQPTRPRRTPPRPPPGPRRRRRRSPARCRPRRAWRPGRSASALLPGWRRGVLLALWLFSSILLPFVAGRRASPISSTRRRRG